MSQPFVHIGTWTIKESLSETLAQFEAPGMTVTKMPVYEAGFTRSNAAP